MKLILMLITFFAMTNPVNANEFGLRFKSGAKRIVDAPDKLAQKIQELYDNSKGDFIDDRETRDELILMAKINLQDEYENLIFLASKKKDSQGFEDNLKQVCGEVLARKIIQSVEQFENKWSEFDRHDKIEFLAEDLAESDLKETIRVAEEEVTPMLRVKANKVSQFMKKSKIQN